MNVHACDLLHGQRFEFLDDHAGRECEAVAVTPTEGHVRIDYIDHDGGDATVGWRDPQQVRLCAANGRPAA